MKEWIILNSSDSLGVLAPLIRYEDGQIQPNQGGFASLLTYILQFFKIGSFLRRRNFIQIIRKNKRLCQLLSLNSSIKAYLVNYSPNPIRKKVDWVSGAFMVAKDTQIPYVKRSIGFRVLSWWRKTKCLMQSRDLMKIFFSIVKMRIFVGELNNTGLKLSLILALK